MISYIEYAIWVSSVILAIGFGFMSGYYICLRNHRLIKHEYEMFDKKMKRGISQDKR